MVHLLGSSLVLFRPTARLRSLAVRMLVKVESHEETFNINNSSGVRCWTLHSCTIGVKAILDLPDVFCFLL